MVDLIYVSTPMDGKEIEILTEEEIKFLDNDAHYQQHCDETDRHWWEAQDEEMQNKSLQKWFEFLQENFK
jgi:hypothetical protein